MERRCSRCVGVIVRLCGRCLIVLLLWRRCIFPDGMRIFFPALRKDKRICTVRERRIERKIPALCARYRLPVAEKRFRRIALSEQIGTVLVITEVVVGDIDGDLRRNVTDRFLFKIQGRALIACADFIGHPGRIVMELRVSVEQAAAIGKLCACEADLIAHFTGICPRFIVEDRVGNPHGSIVFVAFCVPPAHKGIVARHLGGKLPVDLRG